jgi:hypothetical protein
MALRSLVKQERDKPRMRSRTLVTVRRSWPGIALFEGLTSPGYPAFWR